MRTQRAELLIDCRNRLGEGIVWSTAEQCLYWTDIDGRNLWRFAPDGGPAVSRPMRSKLCSIAFRRNGGLLLALERDLCGYDPETGAEFPIAKTEGQDAAVRLNDGRCDRNGRFFVGDYDPESRGRSALWRLDPDGTLLRLFDGFDCANSICFSPDGSEMYFTDSTKREILAFEYDAGRGLPGKSRIFCRLGSGPGLPDGSAVDSEGFLWNAEWAGGRVVRYDPGGAVDCVVEVPAGNPSCVAFGGPDLTTLYITTARNGLSPRQLEEQPTAGGVYAVDTGVTGLPESQFDG